jgi:ABC-type bacteriocin/lantibiotic exporter with double-glycine peptidase domain
MISHRTAILKNCTSIYSLNNGHLMLSNDEK